MTTVARTPQALEGVHILSLSLNLPGPVALLRLRHGCKALDKLAREHDIPLQTLPNY
ncbi:MAG: hypothetical protein WA012_15805 [Rhodoferax sp.]|jgi:hypothetical protein|uniref:hypothetical protein n=1 Tax=Rhodoferax sp. TaxID=50421 RepID=UPI003BB04226